MPTSLVTPPSPASTALLASEVPALSSRLQHSCQGGGRQQLTYPQHRERWEQGVVPPQLPAGCTSLVHSPGQERHHPLVIRLVPASDSNTGALCLWQPACWASAVPEPLVGGGGRGPALLSRGHSQKGFSQKLNFSLSKREFLIRPFTLSSTPLFHILSCPLWFQSARCAWGRLCCLHCAKVVGVATTRRERHRHMGDSLLSCVIYHLLLG